jgi:4-amino-4-deoxy-L-arabinose transferase-like glycosyltransferase
MKDISRLIKPEWFFMNAVFAFAVFLNLYKLGNFGFWGDELYHVFAAKSLLENGTMCFPGGIEYTRSYPFTYLVALSFNLFGISEFSARLPSVFFGLLFLLCSTILVRRMDGGYTATIYGTIIGLSPFALQVARQCRMYTVFLFFFFFSIVFVWIAMNRIEKRCSSLPVFRHLHLALWDIKTVAALAVSAACLMAALLLHSLAVSMVVVLVIYCLGMLVHSALNNGMKMALNSIYILALFLCACGLIWAIIEHQRVASIIDKAFALPKWATYMKSEMSSNFYRYYLQNNFPAMFFIFPIALILLIKQKPALGILSFSCFIPIFLLHSFAFPLKQERYIYHVFPFFALTNAFFIRRFLWEAWERMWQFYSIRKQLFKIVIGLSFLFGSYVFFYPWLAQSKSEISQPRWSSDWKGFAAQYGSALSDQQATVITTSQNHFYYYFGRRPEFYLRASYRPGDVDAEFHLNSETVYTLEQFKKVVESHSDVMLITEYGLGNRDYYTDDIANYIDSNMINAYDSGGFLRVYLRKGSPHMRIFPNR